jgi:ssDNA-binding Zn-finger/Zn-ribbon topoisomerase 1
MAKLGSLSEQMKEGFRLCPYCDKAYNKQGLKKCPRCGGDLHSVKQLEREGKKVDDYEIER